MTPKALSREIIYWCDVKPKNATLEDLIKWVLTKENK